MLFTVRAFNLFELFKEIPENVRFLLYPPSISIKCVYEQKAEGGGRGGGGAFVQYDEPMSVHNGTPALPFTNLSSA
jgi:hypothetical protein